MRYVSVTLRNSGIAWCITVQAPKAPRQQGCVKAGAAPERASLTGRTWAPSRLGSSVEAWLCLQIEVLRCAPKPD